MFMPADHNWENLVESLRSVLKNWKLGKFTLLKQLDISVTFIELITLSVFWTQLSSCYVQLMS